MRPGPIVVVGLALLMAGCGGSSGDASASASRGIVVSSTNTPGPPPPTPSGPAAPVSTVLTPFATSITTPSAGASAAATPAPSTAASAGGASGAANPNAVRIQDFGYTPPTLDVKAGTQVTWTNGGPSNHTVTANDGSFDSGTIQRNGNFAFTFSQAGSFDYHCSIHPTMLGTVRVS